MRWECRGLARADFFSLEFGTNSNLGLMQSGSKGRVVGVNIGAASTWKTFWDPLTPSWIGGAAQCPPATPFSHIPLHWKNSQLCLQWKKSKKCHHNLTFIGIRQDIVHLHLWNRTDISICILIKIYICICVAPSIKQMCLIMMMKIGGALMWLNMTKTLLYLQA